MFNCGCKKASDNGNGSLMRILPMALYQYAYHNQMITCQTHEVMEPVHDVSSLTHAHKRSLIACGLYTQVIGFILNSKNERTLIQCVDDGLKNGLNYYGYIKADEYEYELKKYSRLRDLESFVTLPEIEINSSGYVVDTLEAAIWCLLTTDSYEGCVLKAVNLGEDTDTVGAVAGGLAGVYYGYDNIPEKWKAKIAKRDWIEELCNELFLTFEVVK